MYPNDKPGLGIDIDEELAAQYPPVDEVEFWTQARWPDGSPAPRRRVCQNKIKAAALFEAAAFLLV